MTDETFRRGDVWIGYVGAVTGKEQTGTRPVLILSSHQINVGPYSHVLVAP